MRSARPAANCESAGPRGAVNGLRGSIEQDIADVEQTARLGREIEQAEQPDDEGLDPRRTSLMALPNPKS